MKHPKQVLMDKVLHLKPTPAAVAARTQPITTVSGPSDTIAMMETAPIHPLFDTTPNGLITTPKELIDQRAAAMGLEVTWISEPGMSVPNEEHNTIGGTFYAKAVDHLIESFANPTNKDWEDVKAITNLAATKLPFHPVMLDDNNLTTYYQDGEPVNRPMMDEIRRRPLQDLLIFNLCDFGPRGVGEGLVFIDSPKPRGREQLLATKVGGTMDPGVGELYYTVGGRGSEVLKQLAAFELAQGVGALDTDSYKLEHTMGVGAVPKQP